MTILLTLVTVLILIFTLLLGFAIYKDRQLNKPDDLRTIDEIYYQKKEFWENFEGALDIIFILFIIGIVYYLIGVQFIQSQRERYSNGAVYVETNRIGCDKYRYYNEVYWKCPKELNISHIETIQGKQTVNEPVINKEWRLNEESND